MTRFSRAIGALSLSLGAIGYPPLSLAQPEVPGPRLVGSDLEAGSGWGVTRLLNVRSEVLALSCEPMVRTRPGAGSIGAIRDGISSVRTVASLSFWPTGGVQDASEDGKWAILNGRVLAQRLTPEAGAELWTLDIETGMWTPMGETIAGFLGGGPRLIRTTASDGTAAPAGRAFMVARDESMRERVWRSDGTAAGLLAVTPHGSAWSLVPLGQDMLVLGYAIDRSEATLWRIGPDDDAAGVLGAWAGGFPGSMERTASGIEFAVSTADEGAGSTTLYRFDGAVQMMGIVFGRAEFLGAGDRDDDPRFLRAREADGRQSLWSFTPGAGATRLTGAVASIETWAMARDLRGRASIVFSATEIDSPSARTLWVSDGTASGTYPLNAAGVSGFNASRVWLADQGLVYFTAEEPSTGAELWRTDGTPIGTHAMADLAPGPASSHPHEPVVAGSRLYLAAITGEGGTDEIWSIDLCPADFDNSGTISVQDLFDYLAAYFSLDPRADVNRSLAIGVQDVFDYLRAFFGGCP